MREREMTEKLREKYVEDATGNKPRKTVEQALQEALDNTTPEHSGSPDYTQSNEEEEEGLWI